MKPCSCRCSCKSVISKLFLIA